MSDSCACSPRNRSKLTVSKSSPVGVGLLGEVIGWELWPHILSARYAHTFLVWRFSRPTQIAVSKTHSLSTNCSIFAGPHAKGLSEFRHLSFKSHLLLLVCRFSRELSPLAIVSVNGEAWLLALIFFSVLFQGNLESHDEPFGQSYRIRRYDIWRDPHRGPRRGTWAGAWLDRDPRKAFWIDHVPAAAISRENDPVDHGSRSPKCPNGDAN